MSQIVKNSEEELFWKDVCDKQADLDSSTNQNENTNIQDRPNGNKAVLSEKMQDFVLKCKTTCKGWLNNDIGKWMLIFFVVTLTITFLILIVVNPPIVQINKKLDKRRSFLKIVGISLLMGIIASIVVPIGLKCWKNRQNVKNQKTVHPLTPHLQLTPL